MSSNALERVDCDVAIVGAGPVGATLAALLGQAGLSVFVGDSSHEIYPLPRAAHFDHEIMRVFQQLGITAHIASSIVASDRYVFQNRAGDVLLDFDWRRPQDTGWQGYMMHQPGIEQAIRDRIAGDAMIDLRTEVSYMRMRQAADRVETVWRGTEGEFEVSARFVVGCDGSWSPVRESIGVGLEDLQFDEPWLVLDLIVDAENDLPTISIQYCDPNRPTTYVVMGNDRRRFEFMLKPGESAAEMVEDAAIERLLQPWSTRGLRAVERKAVYRFHALVADRWHDGRVFIAGDAAHQMPPFAGQGMCSGIRDAVALAWRLPLALRSADTHVLLESYQAEREPHVRAITESAIATGRVVCTLDPAAAATRDAGMLAAKAAGAPMPDISSPALKLAFGLPGTPRAGERFFQPVVADGDCVMRLDDVLGPTAWLIVQIADAVRDAERGAVAASIRVVALDDPLLTPFSAALDDWLAKAGTAAVLVRADRYVFATGEPADLIEAYTRLAGLDTVVADFGANA